MMTTPKQALIDTNVLVALVDARNTCHASAHAVGEALKATATSLVYCDSVLNEAIGVLARRAQEQRRVDQFPSLVHALLHEVPTEIIGWLSSETQRLYDQVIELVQSTSGDLNSHAADGSAVSQTGWVQEAQQIALTCRAFPAGRQRWTLTLLADKLVALDIVDRISPECVRTT